MKKIIGVWKPFELKQNFYVYDNGNKIDAISIKMDEINNTIFNLQKKYNINDIELIGPKQFSKGIKNLFLAEEKNKFNKNKTNINII